MKNAGTRLVICSTLMTLSFLLILFGSTWMEFLGLGFISLALYFSSQQLPGGWSIASFLLCVAGAGAILDIDLNDRTAFAPRTHALWFWIAVVGIWLWRIISEFRWWRKSRGLT
jgi:hypothetical protein